MNTVQLIGRLTTDPNVKPAGDRTVCEMRIAIDRPKGKGADFIDVHTWGKLAETCGKHLTKGRLIACDGRLRHEEWTTDTGKRHRVLVVADEIRFLDKPPAKTE